MDNIMTARKLKYWIRIDDNVMDYLKNNSIKWVDATPNDVLRRKLLREKAIKKGISNIEKSKTRFFPFMCDNKDLNILLQIVERVLLHKIPRKIAISLSLYDNQYSEYKIKKLINDFLGLSMKEFDEYLEGDIHRLEYMIILKFPDYDRLIERFIYDLFKKK